MQNNRRMKRILRVILLLSILGGSYSAQAWRAVISESAAPLVRWQPTETALPKFTPEQLREDFQIARQALEEGHSGLYRYTAKATLDRIFDSAAKSLNRPMTAFEFYRVLAPAVAAIKCGHTRISLPSELQRQLDTNTPLLPFSVRVLGDKVYVLRDYSDYPGKQASLAGKEIRSINGIAAARLIATMMAAAPGDGDVKTSRRLRIGGMNFARNLISLFDLTSPYQVTLREAKTRSEIKVKVEGLAFPKLRAASQTQYPQDQPNPLSGELKLLDNGKTAVMTIRVFGGYVDAEKKKNLAAFFKESFTTLQSNQTQSLILDLRNNGGGEDILGKQLLSYLLKSPFKYYDELVVNARSFQFSKYTARPVNVPEAMTEARPDGRFRALGHPNLGMQQPSAPTFSGKVYVLINGGSFSTTSEFLSLAHFHRRAVFIGEESGGGYYGNSSGFVPVVTLPQTKLGVPVPLMTYYLAVSGYPYAARGLKPDHQVEPSIATLLAGIDQEMALALDLARQPHSK